MNDVDKEIRSGRSMQSPRGFVRLRAHCVTRGGSDELVAADEPKSECLGRTVCRRGCRRAPAWPTVAPAAHYVEEGNGCYSCHSLNSQEGGARDELHRSGLARGNRRADEGLQRRDGPGEPWLHVLPLARRQHRHEGSSHALRQQDGQAPGGVRLRRQGGDGQRVPEHDRVRRPRTSWTAWTATTRRLLDDPGIPSYVGHVAPTAALRNPNNPYMLRSVTVAGQYDDLCRRCHGSAAPLFKTRNVRLASHGDGTGGAQAIVEQDGTTLPVVVAAGATSSATRATTATTRGR